MIHTLQDNTSPVLTQVNKEYLQHRNLQPSIVTPKVIMIHELVAQNSLPIPTFLHYLPTP